MMNQKKEEENKQNEVMKSNPHPVVERKWCNRSHVTYKYQPFDNNLASTG